MKEKWLLFVVASILTWGAYVPTIGKGGAAFGGPPGSRGVKAFLFIGLAYFLMAVLIPGIYLWMNQDWGGFNFTAGKISTIAGALGALGALGIIFALSTGGKDKAFAVAPLVFAGAPIMSVFVSMIWDYDKVSKPGAMFYVGILLAAAGAALVLLNRPVAAAHGAAPTAPASATQQSSTTTSH